MKIKCDVFKFNPDSDTQGKFATYRLDMETSDTVLDALIQIYQNYDPALAFRYACGVVRCGECAMLVNGAPCLACEKSVEPEMKIEPLANLPLVKDLVVDRRGVFDRIFKRLPRLSEITATKAKLRALDLKTAKESIEQSVQLSKCFECLICQSSCPIYACEEENFVGPLGLLWLAQMCVNPANEPIPTAEVKRVLTPCLHCGACSEKCPAEDDLVSLALDILDSK